jgi:hypothetical protein
MDAQKAYYDALRNGSEPTYFFFGKSSPWNEEDQIDTSITDNTVLELTKGSDIILAKRLNANDIMPCAKRVDWKPGEVYNQYDMELNMNYVEKHYVLTDEFNVYKCLSNNNGGPSLEKPTGTGFIPFETTDDYKCSAVDYRLQVQPLSRQGLLMKVPHHRKLVVPFLHKLRLIGQETTSFCFYY